MKQFKKLQTTCSTSMEIHTYSSTLVLKGLPTAPPQVSTTATTSVSPIMASSAKDCRGQFVQPKLSKSSVPPLNCDDLSDKYNVSTGDLKFVTQDDYCEFNQPICLPPPCELDKIINPETWYVSYVKSDVKCRRCVY
jgi:hypothetical protein